jgi:hypothetical protein
MVYIYDNCSGTVLKGIFLSSKMIDDIATQADFDIIPHLAGCCCCTNSLPWTGKAALLTGRSVLETGSKDRGGKRKGKNQSAEKGKNRFIHNTFSRCIGCGNRLMWRRSQ